MFFSYFIPSMGRKTDWRMNVLNAKCENDITTNSNEAFALLCLENQWDRWFDIFCINDGKIVSRRRQKRAHSESKKKPKYTRGGITYIGLKKEDHDSEKGWSSEGIARDNQLYEFVAQDRKNNPQFFYQWSESEKGTLGEKKIRKKKPDIMPVAMHDAFSDGEGAPTDAPVKEGNTIVDMGPLINNRTNEDVSGSAEVAI